MWAWSVQSFRRLSVTNKQYWYTNDSQFRAKKVILGLNAKLLPHENLLFRGNHNLFWVFYVSVFHFVFSFFVTFYFVTVCNLVTLLLCIFFTFSIVTSSLVTLKLFNLVQLSLLFRHTKKKCFCFYLCIL